MATPYVLGRFARRTGDALALSLPLSFPDREAIINMTFVVVLFTLLVPGLTMEPLVRFLGMAPKK